MANYQQQGMFGAFGDVFTPEDEEALAEKRARQYAEMDLGTKSVFDAQMAGRGLAKGLGALGGADVRSRGETQRDTVAQIQASVAQAGAQPGTEEYYQLLISEFTKHGMLDAAARVQTQREASQRSRSQTARDDAQIGLYDAQAERAQRVPERDALTAQYSKVVQQLQDGGEFQNPNLIQARDSIARLLGIKPEATARAPTAAAMPRAPIGFRFTEDGSSLERIPGGPEPREGRSPVAPSPRAPVGYRFTKDGASLEEIPGGPPRAGNGNPRAGNGKPTFADVNVDTVAKRSRELLESGSPTESGVGDKIDSALAFFGMSTKGGDDAQRLRVLGGTLVAKVPRFEGPQSDSDIKHYKEIAGRIGDPTVPQASRLAALEEVQAIHAEVASGQRAGRTPDGGKRRVRFGDLPR